MHMQTINIWKIVIGKNECNMKKRVQNEKGATRKSATRKVYNTKK